MWWRLFANQVKTNCAAPQEQNLKLKQENKAMQKQIQNAEKSAQQTNRKGQQTDKELAVLRDKVLKSEAAHVTLQEQV